MPNTLPSKGSQDQKLAVPDRKLVPLPKLRPILGSYHSREYGSVYSIQDDRYSALCIFLPSCPYPFDYGKQLIDRANAHDALVEALQELYDATPTGFGNDYNLNEAQKKAEAALKLARG